MYYTENGITVYETDLTGNLVGFPLEIVHRMVYNAQLQGNTPNTSISAFQYSLSRNKNSGGFNWDQSLEQYDFWDEIINNHYFNVYFNKYPQCKGTYVLEESDQFPWINSKMPKELVQLVIRTAIIQNKRNQLKEDVLGKCFIWSKTPQGWDFWHNIANANYSIFKPSIKNNTNTALLSEELSQRDVLSAVKRASLQLQSDLLASENALEDNKAKLAEAKTTYPLDIQNIINIQLKIEELEDGIKRAQAIKEELGL